MPLGKVESNDRPCRRIHRPRPNPSTQGLAEVFALRKSDLLGVGFLLAAAALRVLIDSVSLASISLIAGVALIAYGHMKKDEHEAPFDTPASLGLSTLETKPIARPSKIDVQLTPSGGPSPEVTLAVLNQGDAREFSAQCTLLALRNSPNELSRNIFDLKWEHTFHRKTSITKGESQNL